MLDDIEGLVRRESPSNDESALRSCAELVDEIALRELGLPAERVVSGGREHLVWRLGSGARTSLLLGHFDTVWPLDSLERLPWSRNDGVLRGPGCFDMKTGLVQILHAVGLLRERYGDDGVDGVTIALTSDEEVGSPTSRTLLEEEARRHRACFVTEAAGPDGTLKLARKGVSLYRVRAVGRAAHAGLEPENGVNAAVEIAHQVLRVSELGDAELGTTVTPTVVTAGSATNTVPARAVVDIDVRVATLAEQERVDADLRALDAAVPGSRIEVEGGANRPPMEEATSAGLFRLAQGLADQLGLTPLRGIAVGGASDGNFTAGVGTPTLDGLGAVGGGAHADTEHVDVSEIPSRTALLAALVHAVNTGWSDHAD